MGLADLAGGDLGADGSWYDIVPDGDGWVAVGEGGSVGKLVSIELVSGGLEIVGSVDLDGIATRVARSDDRVAAAGADGIAFYARDGAGFTSTGSRPDGAADYPWSLGLDGTTAILAYYQYPTGHVLSLVPEEPSSPVVALGISGLVSRPVAMFEGWLLPQTSNFWQGCYTEFVLLDVGTATLTSLGSIPCISSTDGQDGAFDAAAFGSEVLVANGESDVLRAPWDPVSFGVSGPTTLTPAIWPDVPRMPTQIEIVGDVAVLAGDDVGAVQICP